MSLGRGDDGFGIMTSLKIREKVAAVRPVIGIRMVMERSAGVAHGLCLRP